MVRLTLKLCDSISNVEASGLSYPPFFWGGGGDLSLVFYWNFDTPIPKLLKLFVINSWSFKKFLYIYLLNQLKPDLSRMNHMLTMISWNLFYPPLHDGFNILCTSKMNCSFTSLSGLLCNCPSLIFYNAVRFWGIIF